jgi:MFS family permease
MTATDSSSALYRDRNVQIIFAICLMSVLGVASVTPAFPKLAQALEVPPERIGLLVTVFTFPTVLLGPVLGVLADRLGRKAILIPALLLFGIAGSACALARDYNLLLVLRCLQGIGAAPLLSLSITLIGDLFTGDRRVAAMGLNATVSSMGTASYPTLGGLLAVFGWFYPFLLPVLAIPIALWAVLGLKHPEPQSNVDLSTYFVNVAKGLRNRRIVGLFISSAANFVLLYGAHVTFLPLLIAQKFQATSFEIGLVLSSLSVAIALISSQLGKLARRYSTRSLIRVSYILFAIAMLLVPFMPTLWALLLPTMIFGVGLGMNFPSIQTLLAELAPREALAAIISINGTFFGLGQTLGPLLTGTTFAWGGMDAVFFGSSLFAIVILFIYHYCTCL